MHLLNKPLLPSVAQMTTIKSSWRHKVGRFANLLLGSLEEIVENLVKTWEAQASHFKNFYQWTTVDHDDYNVRVNGGSTIPGKIAYEIGNYNALMMECPAYKKCKQFEQN